MVTDMLVNLHSQVFHDGGGENLKDNILCVPHNISALTDTSSLTFLHMSTVVTKLTVTVLLLRSLILKENTLSIS